MNTEYRRAIVDAVARITATTIVDGEAQGNLIGTIAARVADLAAPTNQAASEVPAGLVDRFLSWPVPADVYPDGTPGQPGRTGTNLLSAPQAAAMLRHVLAG